MALMPWKCLRESQANERLPRRIKCIRVLGSEGGAWLKAYHKMKLENPIGLEHFLIPAPTL